MRNEGWTLSCYDILQLHPAAPLPLIAAAYWRLANQAQARRTANSSPEEAILWTLARAYSVLANPRARAAHDEALGIPAQERVPRMPTRRRSTRRFFGRAAKRKVTNDAPLDYYEVLRVAPSAESCVIDEAHSILQGFYQRLIQMEGQPAELVDYLDEAYAVLSDPERRHLYDETHGDRYGEGGKAVGLVRHEGKHHRQAVEEEEQAPSGNRPELVLNATVPRQSSDAGVVAADPAVPVAAPGSSIPEDLPLPRAPIPAADAVPAREADVERGGPLRAVTGGASHLVRSFGRQLSSMSKREADQRRLVAKRNLDPGRVKDRHAEDILLARLSVSAGAANGRPSSEGRKRVAVKLELVEGPGQGTAYEISQLPITIGADACDISLPGLASHRVRLLYRDGRFVVYSLAGSGEGEVGDAAPWWVLESGDDLRLGPYTLRFTARGDNVS